MYYIGTEQQCNDYNNEISTLEGYSGTTSAWARVIAHSNGVDFAILKNESHSVETDMIEAEALSSDWFDLDNNN